MNRTTECTSHCTPKIASLMLIVITNFVLAVPTAAANALVIGAILTTSSLRTPSYFLLTNLAFSDLGVGLFCQPGYAFFVIMNLFEDVEFNYSFFLSVINVSLLLSCVSVLTITAISVDRYLAIRLKLRYRSFVTLRRVRLFCVFSWFCPGFSSVVLSFTPSLVGIVCTVAFAVCLVVTVVSYTMSFRALKIHCAQIQPQGNQQPNSTTQSNAIDVLKYRKLLKTIFLIMMLIFVSYMLLLGILLMFHLRLPGGAIVWGLMTIVCVNSTLNPVIYLTRMKDIRKACVQILRKLFRCKDRQNENTTVD